jgi:hypothetical protein
MSNDTLRIILAIVVSAHGIGHVLFLVPSLGLGRLGTICTVLAADQRPR